MILILRNGLPEAQISEICERLQQLGLTSQTLQAGSQHFVIILDDVSTLASHLFSQLNGVDKVIRTQPNIPLALKGGELSIKFANGACLGGGGMPIVIAGPCSVEERGQTLQLAEQVKASGAQLSRGGAFKPRTNPYDFSGLGQKALEYLAEAKALTSLPIVSEVMSPRHIEQAEPYVDVYQIGARNMYNYELLREVGKTRKPVLLKRAFSATINELLQAAEYILLEGNLQVILCERGIRTFETHTRNTLDLTAVAVLKGLTQLPVLVDPSHATGRRELIRPMSRAAIACGADGLLIEVHANPAQALSDGAQAITPSMLEDIVKDLQAIYGVVGRHTEDKPNTESAPLDHVISQLVLAETTG